MLPVGAVVEISLGRRLITGIVFDSQRLATRKLTFKKGVDFELKSIKRVINGEPRIQAWQLRVAALIASRYAEPLGECLRTVLPAFWEKVEPAPVIQNSAPLSAQTSMLITFEPPHTKDHATDYLKKIKDALAQGAHVCILVAEEVAARYFEEAYVEFKPLFYSSSLSLKKQKEAWQTAISAKPHLLICTRSGLFLPFKKLGLLIIDDESNEAYKSDMSPRYNAADIAPDIARIHGAECLISATVPRLETIYRLGLAPQAPRVKATIVDMVWEIKSANFSPLSRYVQDQLYNNAEDKKLSVLFVPHRGYATTTVCPKCGQTVKCTQCSTPLVAHADGSMRCHRCGLRTAKPKACAICGAYGLKAHGVGIEKAEQAVKNLFSRANLSVPPLWRFDSDETKNKDAYERKIIESWQASGNGILIATHILFSYQWLLNVPFIGILEAETTSHFPDFRADERLVRQMCILGSMADSIAVQTYAPEHPALQAVVKNEQRAFLNAELADRRAFGYPPFVNITKLTFRHLRADTARNEARITAEKLKRLTATILSTIKFRIDGPLPAYASKDRGRYVWHIIVRSTAPTTKSAEQMRTRNTLLDALPHGWTVDVDPLTLL